MDVGYARVSTGEQTLDLQRDALAKAGCTKVFEETTSSAKADRTLLKEAPRRRHPRRLAPRPPRALPAPPDRVRRRPRNAGDRVQEPHRADRHRHPGRQARLPRLRGAGRVRARPYPGADPLRPRRGAGAGTETDRGGAKKLAGRPQASCAGAAALCGRADGHRYDLPHPRDLARDPLPCARAEDTSRRVITQTGASEATGSSGDGRCRVPRGPTTSRSADLAGPSRAVGARGPRCRAGTVARTTGPRQIQRRRAPCPPRFEDVAGPLLTPCCSRGPPSSLQSGDRASHRADRLRTRTTPQATIRRLRPA